MKIAIVTMPLGNNYGGLLQAYALQETLKRLGHDVWILQRGNQSKRHEILRACRNIIYLILHKFYVSQKDKITLSKNTIYFSSQYINPKTPKLRSQRSLRNYLVKNGIEAIIVGSDQVWRPRYVDQIEHYFLNFSSDIDVKRISYAASFGVDKWEFSDEQTKTCKQLLEKFCAVSVREDTGVKLCKDYFDREACVVLDPTLLLEMDDYVHLINAENESPREGDVFCYFLDRSSEGQEVVRRMKDKTGLSVYTCMPKKTVYSEMNRENKDEFVYPSVTRWLRSFHDAKIVLTDSFHGCVFSIIFNKPFWVLCNKERGVARFHSLLQIFGLQNRIIDTTNIDSIKWDENIDWIRVNQKRTEWMTKSFKFLTNALS